MSLPFSVRNRRPIRCLADPRYLPTRQHNSAPIRIVNRSSHNFPTDWRSAGQSSAEAYGTARITAIALISNKEAAGARYILHVLEHRSVAII